MRFTQGTHISVVTQFKFLLKRVELQCLSLSTLYGLGSSLIVLFLLLSLSIYVWEKVKFSDLKFLLFFVKLLLLILSTLCSLLPESYNKGNLLTINNLSFVNQVTQFCAFFLNIHFILLTKLHFFVKFIVIIFVQSDG